MIYESTFKNVDDSSDDIRRHRKVFTKINKFNCCNTTTTHNKKFVNHQFLRYQTLSFQPKCRLILLSKQQRFRF